MHLFLTLFNSKAPDAESATGLLASVLLAAVVTDNIHGSKQVQAEYAGFDALANQLFGPTLIKAPRLK